MIPMEEDIGLEKTMRLLPHDDNNGGFYVALLERTAEIVEENRVSNTTEHIPPLASHLSIDPFISMSTTEGSSEIFAKFAEFYGLDSSFPWDCLFSRGGRQIYFVSAGLRDVLVEKLSIVIAGVRMFEENKRFHGSCCFRLAQEGIYTLYPYLGRRVLILEPSDMMRWLRYGTEGIVDVTKMDPPFTHVAFDEDWAQGSIVVATSHPFLVVAEKGARSLRPFVNREELKELVRHLECLLS